MTDQAVATIPEQKGADAAIVGQVLLKGDLAKLSEAERIQYHDAVCRSLGLNPLTRPFDLINLNGKLTLYAKRDAADQLRKIHRVTIVRLDKEHVGDLYVVTAYGRTPDGREDAATGAVNVKGVGGEFLANAFMKAETKAKRRLTLSLVGLGFPSEDELEDMPEQVEVTKPERKSLADKVAEKTKALSAGDEPTDEATTAAEFTEVTDGEPDLFEGSDAAPAPAPQDEAAPAAETPGADSAATNAASSALTGYPAFRARFLASDPHPSEADVRKAAKKHERDIPDLAMKQVKDWPLTDSAWVALGDALNLPAL